MKHLLQRADPRLAILGSCLIVSFVIPYLGFSESDVDQIRWACVATIVFVIRSWISKVSGHIKTREEPRKD